VCPAADCGSSSIAEWYSILDAPPAIRLHRRCVLRGKQQFERALELTPNDVMARSWYALFCFQWSCGEFERGIAEARRALERDPLSAYLMAVLGVCLFTAGRADEAIATCRRAVQHDPESFVARWALGTSLRVSGRLDEAASTLEAAATMSHRRDRRAEGHTDSSPSLRSGSE